MSKTFKKTITLDFGVMGEREVEVDFYYTPGSPSKTYGPPEDCYEGWDEEFEINSVMLGKTDIGPWLDADGMETLIEALKNSDVGGEEDDL